MAEYITKSLACDLLPGDLMLDIVCRLPVKSLMRFKCVNKTWYFVIKNRWFIKMHYDHVSKLESDNFIVSRTNKTESELGVIAPGPMGTVRNPGTGRLRNRRIPKGLICLTPWGPRFGRYFTLRNPAIGSSKLITSHQDPNSVVSAGFGFDERHNDFKFFKLEQLKGSSDVLRPFKVHIYSFRANSWKITVSSQDFVIRDQVPIAMLGSCMYWPSVTLVDRQCRIAVFNLSTETFHVSRPFPGKCTEVAGLRPESLAMIFYGNDKAGGCGQCQISATISSNKWNWIG